MILTVISSTYSFCRIGCTPLLNFESGLLCVLMQAAFMFWYECDDIRLWLFRMIVEMTFGK